MHVKQGRSPDLSGLSAKYFPPEILPQSIGMEDLALKREFPARYELFQRELMGTSLLRSSLIHLSENDLGRLNNLQRYLGAHSAEGGTLRVGQVPVFQSLTRFFERGLQSGFVVVPTRGGKTVIFVELVETIGDKTLVLVPTKDLVAQTKKNFTQFAPLLDVGVHYGDKKDGLDHQVVISTYPTWMALVKNGAIKPGDFPLMILDEAHEILSDKKSELIEDFIGSSTVVGFTATDKYSDKKNLLRVLKNQIHRMSINEAVGLNLITGYSVITVETRVDLSDVRTDFARGDYNRVDLASALRQPALTSDAIKLYKQYFPGEVGLISCCGIDHAKDVAAAFTAQGIPTQAVYGDMNDTLRVRSIERHQSGELKILTTAKLLTGGYDNELVSFIFNLEPTMSLKHATQRGGRPLTLNPAVPDKVGVIVEFLHPDEGKQRRQMTFLDATMRAHYAGDKKNSKPKIPSVLMPKQDDSELKVTVAPDAVEKKIEEHSAGRESIQRKTDHRSDRINLAIKALHMERQKVLMSIGATTEHLQKNYSEHKLRPKKECQKLYDVAAKDAVSRYRKLAKDPVESRRAMQLAIDNREVLAHIERKFRGDGLTITDMMELRETFRQHREALNSVFTGFYQRFALPSSLPAAELFAHADPRCVDKKISDERLAQFGTLPPEAEFAKALKKEIAPIEKQLKMRWDTFLDAMDQIDEIESKLRALHQPLMKEAGRIIRDEARLFYNRTLSRKEVVHEAWVSAVPVIDQFIIDGSRSRFSTLLSRALRKELAAVLDEADRAALNIGYTSEYREAIERVDGKSEHDPRAIDYDLAARFSRPVTFFSELDRPLPESGEEITEHDFDPEESIELGLDSLALPALHLDGSTIAHIQMGDIKVNAWLKRLTFREREIIASRYREGLTLEECAKIYHLTRERIRQIEGAAVRKLSAYALQEAAE